MSLDSIQQAAREQFGKQSKRYGAGHILANTSDVSAALSRLQLPKQARALDVATGAGHTALCLAEMGCEVVASDIAAPMLDRVNEAAAERNLQVITRQHSAEELPYPDSSFDLVTSRVAPHHFSSPEAFVRESARVLVPGGWFLLIDGSVPDDCPEASEWLHHVEKLRDPSHNRFLSRAAWRELCEKSGLTVERAELTPFKQPDLEWYFETAATTEENRAKVRELMRTASANVRFVYQLGEEKGKTVWWWPRLELVARKPVAS